MQSAGKIKVLFILGFGPIVRHTAESRKLYSESLGIRFKEESGEYLHTEALNGAKSFALWPLSQAAESCFGKDAWPDNIPVPQAWLEFDVDNVEDATANLESRGYRMQKQERAVGPNGQSLHLTRRITGRRYLHSTDARREKEIVRIYIEYAQITD